MTGIRPDELGDRIADDSGSAPFLLDIRPESAFDSRAIDGSHNVLVYDDLRRGDESALRARLGDLPSDRGVIVICKMGIVAKRATRLSRRKGTPPRRCWAG